jgi:uncharacterized membrane protein YkgB
MNVIIEETIVVLEKILVHITYKVRFSFILTTMPDSWFQRKKHFIYLQFLKVIVGTYTIQHALSSTILTLEPRHFCKSV